MCVRTLPIDRYSLTYSILILCIVCILCFKYLWLLVFYSSFNFIHHWISRFRYRRENEGSKWKILIKFRLKEVVKIRCLFFLINFTLLSILLSLRNFISFQIYSCKIQQQQNAHTKKATKCFLFFSLRTFCKFL